MATERGGWVAGVRRFWPLGVLVLGAVLVLSLGLHRQLSLGALIAEHGRLQEAVAAHPALAAAAFLLVYGTMVACMIPGGIVMSTAGGLLFGVAAGTALTVVAVTTGSTVLLLAARSALRPLALRHAGPMVARTVAALERDGAWYLLAARLLPFAPFWLTNLAASLTRIGVVPFMATTALGMTPITLALTATGAGFGRTLAEGRVPSFETLLRPEVLVPLAATAALCVVPVVWRRWRAVAGEGVS